MNYKNTETGEVISSTCYNRLPESKQANYIGVVDEKPTHEVSEDDSDGDDRFATTLLEAEVISDLLSSDSDSSFGSSNDSSSSTDFGGGDFGGGGASDSY